MAKLFRSELKISPQIVHGKGPKPIENMMMKTPKDTTGRNPSTLTMSSATICLSFSVKNSPRKTVETAMIASELIRSILRPSLSTINEEIKVAITWNAPTHIVAICGSTFAPDDAKISGV
uniref:Uncharacterized protein n=1 Tax=Photinus pyralis TaxID=7054 RepID=A0A1Y1MPP3_PHOPY